MTAISIVISPNPVIMCFAHNLLKISLYHSDIEGVLAIGNNHQGITVTKVVFTNMEARIRLYKARINLRNSDGGIFINEDLTKRREKLNYLARLLFKEKLISNNWTFLGAIFVKKTPESEPEQVTSETDIDRIRAAATAAT